MISHINKVKYWGMSYFFLFLIIGLVRNGYTESSIIEQMIRSGETSTVELIRPEHPRIYMKGNWEWDQNNIGSFAWRIMHGQEKPWPWMQDPANDQSKDEFAYSAGADNEDDYGADNMFQSFDHDFDIRLLEPLIAGKALKLHWQDIFAGTWTLDHTSDEYFADARNKLIFTVDLEPRYEYPYVVALVGAAGYDWLYDETFANGEPILSESDKAHIQSRLIEHADYLKSLVTGDKMPFKASDTNNYYYVLVGLALYEPAKINDPDYAWINEKAKSYLNSFDTDFIGKVLAIWNKQGGDGGWHNGLGSLEMPYWTGGSYETDDNVAILSATPMLFAHYTATNVSIDSSLFSTGILKNFAEFQAFMIRPAEIGTDSGVKYVNIGGTVGNYDRSPWIMPMRSYSRRRFSENAEQLKLAELGGWIRTSFNKNFTDAGSWDTMEQLLFEDKWPSPRSPESIGFSPVRHFKSLGWIFLRTGFKSSNDLLSLFICQPFHWSNLDLYAQNSLSIEYKGVIAKGLATPLFIDNKGQRQIDNSR